MILKNTHLKGRVLMAASKWRNANGTGISAKLKAKG